jgi:hypothetical protein
MSVYVRLVHVGTGKVRIGQLSSRLIWLYQVRPGEVRLCKFWSGSKRLFQGMSF